MEMHKKVVVGNICETQPGIGVSATLITVIASALSLSHPGAKQERGPLYTSAFSFARRRTKRNCAFDK